jgi:hypothetical protein
LFSEGQDLKRQQDPVYVFGSSRWHQRGPDTTCGAVASCHFASYATMASARAASSALSLEPLVVALRLRVMSCVAEPFGPLHEEQNRSTTTEAPGSGAAQAKQPDRAEHLAHSNDNAETHYRLGEPSRWTRPTRQKSGAQCPGTGGHGYERDSRQHVSKQVSSERHRNPTRYRAVSEEASIRVRSSASREPDPDRTRQPRACSHVQSRNTFPRSSFSSVTFPNPRCVSASSASSRASRLECSALSASACSIPPSAFSRQRAKLSRSRPARGTPRRPSCASSTQPGPRNASAQG